MSASRPFRIESAGDLEVAVMNQAHDLMAGIISPFLYTVSGQEGEQQVLFKTQETFLLFAIQVGELVSEARANVAVKGAPDNLSVLTGLSWLSERLSEPSGTLLSQRMQRLSEWMSETDRCRFWCGSLDRHFEFSVPRRQLWSLYANGTKHTFLRLQSVTAQIAGWAAASGRSVEGADVLHVLESFTDWLAGYCEYHSTIVAELIGQTFDALNEVIIERWYANNCTNDARKMRHPEGASAFFQDLHSHTLVMLRYTHARIRDLTPSTGQSLRSRYAV